MCHRTSHPHGFTHSLTHSGERATRSAQHKSARNETLQLCVCAAALVFRVSSGRLVRRLSLVPRRPPYSYNAEDLPDQPHFSQSGPTFLSTRTRIFPRRIASYRSLERSPSGTLAGPYCGGYGAIFFH